MILDAPKKPCIVIGDCFPNWLLHVSTLGYRVEQVLVRSSVHASLIHKICGPDVPVWSGGDLRLLVAGLSLAKGTIVCFVDARITSGLLDALGVVGIQDVISTQTPRRPCFGWHSVFVDVPHHEVGGVTTRVITLVRHSRGLLKGLPLLLPIVAPRDASTVLSHSTFGRYFRPKPLTTLVEPLRCMNLGSMSHPYYHGHGWLPAMLDRSTRVLTPVLNSSTNEGQWALRTLSGEEILLCYDIGATALGILVAEHPNHVFYSSLLPGQCLLAGFHSLFNGGGAPGKEIPGNEIGRELSDDVNGELPSDRDHKEIGRELPEGVNGDRLKSPPLKEVLMDDPETLSSEDAQMDDLIIVAREKRERSAAKADDAEVPEYLWMEHLFEDGSWDWDPGMREQVRKMAEWFRTVMLRRWKRNVMRSFILSLHRNCPQLRRDQRERRKPDVVFEQATLSTDFLASSPFPPAYEWSTEGLGGRTIYRHWWLRRWSTAGQELTLGQDVVARSARASWWAWDDGSRPIHWRWPPEYRVRIRDGLPVHFLQEMKPYRVPQGDEKDLGMKAQLVEKLQKARDRRYIAPGKVVSLTAFFGVKKGENDVRPVYDGSVSGLNDCIWMPRFVLPTIQSHLRQVEAGTFMCDLDVGEMFLNFILHVDIRSLAGVDLTHYTNEGKDGAVWECWHRAAMGLTSSPYQACQGMAFAEEVIRGDRLDPRNIFRWDLVRLNLPGSQTYDPAKPWVSKIRSNDGHIAVDFCTFVDDARPTGPSRKEAWLAARQIASTLSSLGIQDAPRKRRDSSQTPGAWTGSVLRTDEGQVRLLISKEKWDKTKTLLAEVRELLTLQPLTLPRKRLEQIRGYLVHIAQTYSMFASYLIGLHMTIDFWRPNRDQDGWRCSTAFIQGIKDRGEWPEDYDNSKGPTTVSAVPRLTHDIRALEDLTQGDLPLLRRVRARKTGRVLYGFGDASKAAFGATIQIEDRLFYQYGQWSNEIVERESSNWRELSNLVIYLCDLVKKEDLSGYEIYMFTDNSTAEAAFWKGTSVSPRLFELVLQLKRLELDCDVILHVIHISGKRMIAQGTDGLSRADHSQGVMQGKPIQDFVPLHLNPHEREPGLKAWLERITAGLDPTFLTPEGWYTTGHGHGSFVWVTPPAAAEVVVEQLGRARLKRPGSLHLILVPRVMTGRWRRHLTRGTEAYIRIDWDTVWNLETHYEPLLLFICFPYRSETPKLGEQKKLLDLFQRTLLRADVSDLSDEHRGGLLRKFLLQARALCPL
jgi:hypothetical protein